MLHPVSVRLPADLYARLVEDARRNQRSISSQIIYLLRQVYPERDEQAAAAQGGK